MFGVSVIPYICVCGLIMDTGDWATSSGGSSDSDVNSPESDNEDHCYAYGDIPKLQFRYMLSICFL